MAQILAAVADGTLFPYAEDTVGLWHRRPADDNWAPFPARVQCRTVCGDAIGAVHVSESEPEFGLCPACFLSL